MIQVSSFPGICGQPKAIVATVICDLCDETELTLRIGEYGAVGPAPIAEASAKQAGWMLIADAKGGHFKGHACPACAGDL